MRESRDTESAGTVSQVFTLYFPPSPLLPPFKLRLETQEINMEVEVNRPLFYVPHDEKMRMSMLTLLSEATASPLRRRRVFK